MAVNRDATRRDRDIKPKDDDGVESWYSAVNQWSSQTPVSPTRRTSTQSGYYPQPEGYYQSGQDSDYSNTNVTYYDNNGRPIRNTSSQQTRPTPAPTRSTQYSFPTNWNSSSNYGRTQTVQQRPAEPPRSTYSVDPLKAAVNRWQSSARPDRTMYDVQEPEIDYGYEAPDIGPNDFTAQQYRPPTRTTPTQQITGQWQGPEPRPTGMNAWLPGNFALTNLSPAANAIQYAYQNPDVVGELARSGFRGWRDELADSAAGERFQYDRDTRAQNFAERGGQSTWLDIWDAAKNAGRAVVQGAAYPLINTYSPEQRAQADADSGRFALGEAMTMLSPAMEAANTNRWTARAAQGAQDVLGAIQVPFDYATTRPNVVNDAPLAPNIAAGLDVMGQNLRTFAENPVEVLTGQSEDYRYFTDFYRGWVEQVGRYRDATAPDTIQTATNSPPNLERNRERSWLNAFGGLDSVEATYDALSNREYNVNQLNQQANTAWEAGAMTEDEDERQRLWAEAADAGSQAWQLENLHPQEIVNQNTNILRQLATELVLPDITDLAAGLFAFTELTPAARRLNRVAGEVSTPVERVTAALDDMVVTGANAAEVAKMRSNYNKALNLWTTGKARAHIATDKMTRYIVNLLGDVETPRDAVVLLNQLASDPRRLITGMDADVFQSPGLLARADGNTVRFGAMNLDNIKEPLRIYQQAAQNILANPVFAEGPLLNKTEFLTTFTDEMNQAGYRFYNVADQVADVPASAKSGRIVGTGNSGEYVVEFVDANKKVIGNSDPMTMQEAQRLKADVGKGVAAQRSVIGDIGQFQRAIVSPFYILTSPGTWVTNILGGVATAVGDGNFSLRSSRYIDDWTNRMYGVDPTQRGFQNIESAGSSASQFASRGPLKFLKNAYSKIDEFTGKKVFYSAANRAMQRLGGDVLNNTLGPILQAAGVDPAQARKIISHLHETGMQGGDLASEFNKLLNGQTRMFSLGDVNKTWLEAVPPDSLNELYTLIRTGTPEAIRDGLGPWMERASSYWDELIAASPPPAQRYTWQALEVTQDTADMQQLAKGAQKYANVPAEQAQAAAKAVSDGMTQVQRNLQTLTQMVTEAADPANRYMLYNVWGQMTDYTANVRAQLMELAEQANTAQGPAKAQAWGNYWTEAQRLWTERNTFVNDMLEQASTAMAAGEDFTPRFNAWDMLERAARRNEEELWRTLRMEPQSGRYDARLQQVIEAGRAVADRAQAQTFAAARRFLNVDAFDYLTSAEHSVQIAGAQVATLLERAREAAVKSGKWEDYFGLRNESWRQLRLYEKNIWENATRNIVREGIGQEANTGLRFDAGPDGVVELVGPRTESGQRTSRMGPQKEVTPQERTVWDVRREDGTVTQVPDNMVPADLKARYNGEDITEAVEEAVDLEVANIQSALPYAQDAEAALSARTRADELMDMMMEDTGTGIDMPFPGSSALDELEAQRAERAAAMREGQAGGRTSMRDEWDRVAKAEGGYLSLDAAIRSYVRNGIANVPENKFEDLYGTVIAGRRIDSQADVERFLQEYYNTGSAQRTARAEAARPPRPEPVPAPSRDVLPTVQQEQLTRVQQTLQANLQRVAERVGTTVDDLIAVGNDAVAQLTQSPIAVQVATDTIDDILEAGELRNSFQVGRTSPGKALDKNYRRTAEARGLGIPENAPPEQRPIYGYLLTNEYARETAATPNLNLGYGDITLVLKDDARARTTFVVGDSNNNFYNSRGVGTPLDEVNELAWGGEATATWEYADSGNLNQYLDDVGYLETQTQGGVRLSDIDSVMDPNNTLSPQQVQRLEQQGITVLRGEESAPAMRPMREMSADEFGAAVQDAANRIKADLGEKVFISRVYDELRRENPDIDINLNEFKRRLAQNHREMLSRADMGYAMNRADVDASEVQNMTSTFHLIRQQPEMRQLDLSVPNYLEDIAKKYGINLWGGQKLDDVGSVADDITRKTTAAGGTHPGELGHGAAFAKQQLENIVAYIEGNLDDILTPRGRSIGEGQNLRALQEFRTRVLPAWDNVKYGAAEYGNRMRSFSMVDFANNTRLDELMSIYMPYGFWMTRTVKNSLERAIFEPHIYRRVAQTGQAIRDMQEQEGAPERYEGAIPFDMGNGTVQWLRFDPGKYWPLAGMFTHNDYADPESANSAFGFAVESMRAANLQSYPWFDIAAKLIQGEANEIYPAQYLPQGRIAADIALRLGGWDAATRWTVPGYFENSVARTLNNMAVKGEITNEQARWAHDYLWQLKNGGEALPEFGTGAFDPAEIEGILDQAVRTTAGVDLQSALSSILTGFSLRPYDTAEDTWSGAAGNYRDYKYGTQNPYGSKLAADSQKPDASLSWSKSGVWRPEEGRPGVSMATDAKSAEKDALNQELMAATDEFILGSEERPSNFEINEFKNGWMAERVDGDGAYFVDDMNVYLDTKYPSATAFEGQTAYEGYAPEEVRQRGRTAAYYQALDELSAQKPIYPTYPGDDATQAQWNEYWAGREQYDADKLAYEQALETRVNELISDPAAQGNLTNRRVINPELRFLGDGAPDWSRTGPQTMGDVYGVPQRPTGAMPDVTQGPMTFDEYQTWMQDARAAGTLFDVGLTPLAGDPADAEAIIEQERTKYMSDLEKETRAANEADGDRSGGRGGYSRSYSRRPWVNYGRGGYSRGYSRRYYGGGGGGAGGNYYAPRVDPQDFALWPDFTPQRYQRPDTRPYWLDTRDIGPREMRAWRPLSWRT